MTDAADVKQAFREVMKGAGITRARAAELLFVSHGTLDAWLKPETSKSSNPVPLWAVDLLARKTGLPPHPVVVKADAMNAAYVSERTP